MRISKEEYRLLYEAVRQGELYHELWAQWWNKKYDGKWNGNLFDAGKLIKKARKLLENKETKK